MTSPKVSIVIPTRNRLELLRRAIQSVLGQTEQNFEVIVVDDGSADGTRTYLETLSKNEPRVKNVCNLHPKGGAAARNIGIAMSAGKWIAFLDDDDEWLPEKLNLQLAALATAPSAVACSSPYYRRRSTGEIELVRIPETISVEDLFLGSVMGGASVCICDAETLRRIGGFDLSFRSGQDWDLWTRLRQVGKIVTCSAPTVLYAAHDGVRISKDMSAQYQGARHFYFKYRKDMTLGTRIHRVAYLCFIKSRQRETGAYRRLTYLILAMSRAKVGLATRYMLSSLPRLIKDAIA